MGSIKSFNEFKKINEAGWDSIDEDAGEILVNGVSLFVTNVCIYDTPNTIAYEASVKPTPEELTEIGIWSEKYVESYTNGEDPIMLIYSNGKELTKKELRSMEAENVRDVNDDQIIEYFNADYMKKIPSDEMTAEQFMNLVKGIEFNQYNEYNDIHFIDTEAAPGYRLLTRLGSFDKK